MAIFHHTTKIISRKEGKSSVASAAYRSGEKIRDEREDKLHDYSRKSGVREALILAPDGSPEWAKDRERLWNEVEKTERRGDAQLARSVEIALPVELSLEEQRALLISYAQKNYVDKGMIADIAFHDKNDGNPHAHIMLTMREVNENGFGKKNRDWNEHNLATEYRKNWEKDVNLALKAKGLDITIDHRSNADRGLEEKPTIHVGPQGKAMEKKGKKHAKAQYNRDVTQFNKQLREARKERQRLWEEKKAEPEKRTMPLKEIIHRAGAKRRELEEMHGLALSKQSHVREKRTAFLENFKEEAVRKVFQPRVDDIDRREDALRENKARLIKEDQWLADNKPGFWGSLLGNSQYKEIEEKHKANIAKHTAWVESYNHDKASLNKEIATARNSPMSEKIEDMAYKLAKAKKPEEIEKFDGEIKKIGSAARQIDSEAKRFKKLEDSLKPRGLSRDRTEKALERPVTVQMDKAPIEGTKIAADALKGILNGKAVGGGGGPKLNQSADINWEWLKDDPAALQQAIEQVKDQDRGL